MDVPDLVQEALGGEEIQAGVNLGDEDTVCLTPSRTLLYRADGLLSDETVEEFPHDVERLEVKEGRRKTKFVFRYVDEARSLSVPANRDEPVLELLMQGILRADDVLENDEAVAGAFRFSELTLVVGGGRVVKHVGTATWTDDYEVYPFADLTGLAFERGSVATEVVLEIDGRPQRIKTPNEDARKVQQVVTEAAAAYHDVSSLEELNATLGGDDGAAENEAAGDSGIDLGDGIDPLVTEEPETSSLDNPMQTSGGTGEPATAAAEETAGTTTADRPEEGAAAAGTGAESGNGGDADAASDADLAAVEAQLSELTTAVSRQNELLERNTETIEQLVEELRQGRG
ncbi:MAG: hypothetical protein ABEJ30_09210 [Halorientalis sp.]